MVPDVEKLKSQRNVYRRRAEKSIADATTLTTDYSGKSGNLQPQPDILQRYVTSLNQYDSQIMELLDDPDEIDADTEESATLQDQLVYLISKLQDIKLQIQGNFASSLDGSARNETVSAIVNNRENSQHNHQYPVQQQVANLPKLELPKFGRDSLAWSSFWDAFESAVHQNNTLSPVAKFTYLKALLKGIAYDSVAGIALNNANYLTAVDLIKERFGQVQTIINAHVEGLVNIPKSTDDTPRLRAMYDSCEIHIRGLETQGITSGATGVILTPILLSKIPDEIRLILSRKHSGPIGNLDTLRKLFREEIEAREVSHTSKCVSRPTYGRNQGVSFTTGAFINASRPHCSYCQDNGHTSFNCNKYVTINQRHNKVKMDRICMNCLNSNHRTMECKSKASCKACGSNHHTTLCNRNQENQQLHSQGANQGNSKQRWNSHQPPNQFRHSPKRSSVNVAAASYPEDQPVYPTPALLTNSTSILMQTALANVTDNSGKCHTIRLLFDTGSHRSYITQSLASTLCLPTESTEVFSIAPFGSDKPTPRTFHIAKLQCNPVGDDTAYGISAAVVPIITCPIYRANVENKGHALKNLKLADPVDSSQYIDIDVLIGLDHYWELVNDQVFRLPEANLTAVSSVFGWLISGTVENNSNHPTQATNLFISSASQGAEDHFLTKFWDSESLNDGDLQSRDEALEQDMVLQQFDRTIIKKQEENRYEVGLPWKSTPCDLPSNYGLCRKRFTSLITRLTKGNLIPRYKEVIDQQLERKIIEQVDDTTVVSGNLHYISHHPVIKDDRATTKLRIVYDASAKQSERHPSLNESLYTGPNLVADLMGLILEFRKHKIVLLADIEKAFLQVSLRPEDRDATRFLWLKDTLKPPTEDNIITYRFLRVLFGATSSPFLLAATIRYHLKSSNEPIAKKLIDKFYVDNLVTGTENLEEAKQLYKDAKKLLLDGGMNLREWASNSTEFRESIPCNDRADGSIIKVLGLPWNTSDDMIGIKGVPELINSKKPTKRQILQTIAKVFDPMGFVSPVIITSKIFIQSLWKTGLSWDKSPSDEVIHNWTNLNKQLSLLSEIKIPRRLQVTNSSQLHVFVDASAKAYAAAAYLRTSVDGQCESKLICSKTRVAPVKSMTIPRLELMAALIGCQLTQFIINTYPELTKVQIWSDSQVVLYWIQNTPKKQNIFVTNRITQIKASGYSFRYCPTNSNPADLPSRGIETKMLKESTLWWSGPQWLPQPENEWPPNVTAATPQIIEETRVVTLVASSTKPTYPFDMDIEKYSNLAKLLRVTSYCSRFVQRFQKKPSNSGPILAEELDSSLMQWIHSSQAASMSEQMKLLAKGKSDAKIKQLNLFLDKGIVRCHGRISNSSASTETKNPILLVKDDILTDLIIRDIHNQLYHQGVRHTLSTLRQSYWLSSARQQIRFVLNRCYVCKLWEGKSFSNPPPAALPALRVTKNPAFTYTGCDFAGPLYVFAAEQPKKAYICLFTCAVTRAVHLEAVEDLTTSSYLMALRRFISRRGIPTKIVSDNAKTFKLAKTTLERLWLDVITSDDVINYISSKGIKWKFNVERAPWWGGFFERMIGLTKRAFIKAIGKTKLTLQEIATTLAEIEAILNARPITYVNDQPNEGQPLSPNNFLSEAKFFALPTAEPESDPDYLDRNITSNVLMKKLRNRQLMLDRFWNTSQKEYLRSLREYHNNAKLSKNNPHLPYVGEVVLIKDENQKRAMWKLGIIQELHQGRHDHHIRAAKVRCGSTFLQRAISHLFPLEISADMEHGHQDDAQFHPRPKRTTALKAKEKIKQYYDDNT